MKPELVVHPGFPKCATTSIQALFMAENHVMARRAGIVWLGMEFKPFGGLPPVMDIGYRPETSITMIEALELDPSARYFLSAESLLGADKVYAALALRFDIRRSILTIRLPVLQALSAFNFSGWMSMTLEQAITSKTAGFDARTGVCTRQVEHIRTQFSPEVLLCPIEAPSLEERFCQQAFGAIPPGVGQMAERVGVRNTSVSAVFATALSEVIAGRTDFKVLPPHRSRLARLAQAAEEPAEFSDCLPPALSAYFREAPRQERQLQTYDRLLARNGVDAETRAICLTTARKRLVALAERPPAPREITRAARDLARSVLRKTIRELTPEAGKA